jgi:hypothetical protein
MEDFPTIGALRPPFRNWRRLTPLASLGAVMVLGFAGWMHFSSPPDESPTPAPPAANRDDNRDRLRASPIRHELDENAVGSVVTASATSLSGTRQNDEESDSNPAAASQPQSAADRHRTSILGKWEDEYRGKRHLTVHEDGTGTMVVEPDGIGKRLFAAELTFELEWALDDERVSMKMIRGEPRSKVQMILKLYGQEAEYRILELTDERMLLLDPDGKTRYDWRRPADGG